MSDTFQSGERLNAGGTLVSENGRFRLDLQGDGNFVLYRVVAAGFQPLWATGTVGTPVAYASMQGDGNLVLCGPSDNPVWATGTEKNPGAFLIVQNDGNVVIYSADRSKVLWATNTVEPDQRVAHRHENEMEFTVKVSRTGIAETVRYAGIKKQSGTYHHHFWFCLLDANEDTIWAMRSPLTLTIGAANTPLGQPSFVSKKEHAVVDVPAEHARSFAKVAIYMERKEGGGGSIFDQIEEADKIYKKLKRLEIIKDAIIAVAA